MATLENSILIDIDIHCRDRSVAAEARDYLERGFVVVQISGVRFYFGKVEEIEPVLRAFNQAHQMLQQIPF